MINFIFFVFYAFAILYLFFSGYKLAQFITIKNETLKEVIGNAFGCLSIYLALFVLNGLYINTIVNERNIIVLFSITYSVYALIIHLYVKKYKRTSLVLGTAASLILIGILSLVLYKTISGDPALTASPYPTFFI